MILNLKKKDYNLFSGKLQAIFSSKNPKKSEKRNSPSPSKIQWKSSEETFFEKCRSFDAQSALKFISFFFLFSKRRKPKAYINVCKLYKCKKPIDMHTGQLWKKFWINILQFFKVDTIKIGKKFKFFGWIWLYFIFWMCKMISFLHTSPKTFRKKGNL